MIYTIVPIEQVMGGANEEEGVKIRSLCASYMGENVLLKQTKAGEFSIERLLSTNPKSYLKKELAPGSAVDIREITLV